MLILALESSAKAASAALCRDGRLLAQTVQNNGLTHSRTLLPMVDSLLQGAGLKLAELDAVAVACGGKELARVCATEVFFRQLTAAEIAAYVATGEPLDKAGAYGIQGRGALLVEKIAGCYNNVVGLPLSMLDGMLKEIGVNMTA